MSNERIDGYARGLFEVAKAEGTLDEGEDELFRFARSYESSEELRTALSDELIPPAKRQAMTPVVASKPTPHSANGKRPAHSRSASREKAAATRRMPRLGDSAVAGWSSSFWAPSATCSSHGSQMP